MATIDGIIDMREAPFAELTLHFKAIHLVSQIQSERLSSIGLKACIFIVAMELPTG